MMPRLDLGDVLGSVQSIAAAMMPPNIPRLSRPAGATTRPTHAVAPTPRQIFAAHGFIVVRTTDGARFDRLLDQAFGLITGVPASAPAAATGTEEIDRVYDIAPALRIHVRRAGAYRILAARPELIGAAIAAHEGRIPHQLAGPLSKPMLDAVPASAGKVMLVRTDLLANMVIAMRLAAAGLGSDRDIYPPFPNIKPAVVYSVEEDKRLRIAASVPDLPVLVQALLRSAPRPPPAPRRAPATAPR